MVPEAGLGQIGALSAISNAHPQCLRHQRHAASKLSNTPILRHFCRLVKPCYYAATNHPILRNYSAKTRSLALSLALNPTCISQNGPGSKSKCWVPNFGITIFLRYLSSIRRCDFQLCSSRRRSSPAVRAKLAAAARARWAQVKAAGKTTL